MAATTASSTATEDRKDTDSKPSTARERAKETAQARRDQRQIKLDEVGFVEKGGERRVKIGAGLKPKQYDPFSNMAKGLGKEIGALAKLSVARLTSVGAKASAYVKSLGQSLTFNRKVRRVARQAYLDRKSEIRGKLEGKRQTYLDFKANRRETFATFFLKNLHLEAIANLKGVRSAIKAVSKRYAARRGKLVTRLTTKASVSCLEMIDETVEKIKERMESEHKGTLDTAAKERIDATAKEVKAQLIGLAADKIKKFKEKATEKGPDGKPRYGISDMEFLGKAHAEDLKDFMKDQCKDAQLLAKVKPKADAKYTKGKREIRKIFATEAEKESRVALLTDLQEAKLECAALTGAAATLLEKVEAYEAYEAKLKDILGAQLDAERLISQEVDRASVRTHQPAEQPAPLTQAEIIETERRAVSGNNVAIPAEGQLDNATGLSRDQLKSIAGAQAGSSQALRPDETEALLKKVAEQDGLNTFADVVNAFEVEDRDYISLNEQTTAGSTVPVRRSFAEIKIAAVLYAQHGTEKEVLKSIPGLKEVIDKVKAEQESQASEVEAAPEAEAAAETTPAAEADAEVEEGQTGRTVDLDEEEIQIEEIDLTADIEEEPVVETRTFYGLTSEELDEIFDARKVAPPAMLIEQSEWEAKLGGFVAAGSLREVLDAVDNLRDEKGHGDEFVAADGSFNSLVELKKNCVQFLNPEFDQLSPEFLEIEREVSKLPGLREALIRVKSSQFTVDAQPAAESEPEMLDFEDLMRPTWEQLVEKTSEIDRPVSDAQLDIIRIEMESAYGLEEVIDVINREGLIDGDRISTMITYDGPQKGSTVTEPFTVSLVDLKRAAVTYYVEGSEALSNEEGISLQLIPSLKEAIDRRRETLEPFGEAE